MRLWTPAVRRGGLTRHDDDLRTAAGRSFLTIRGPTSAGSFRRCSARRPGRPGCPTWFPTPGAHAERAVLLVLDGLGWDQFETHRHLMPTLSSMTGGPIHTVAPTTTATALSSIATGLTPAEHGLIGYRMVLGGEIMNVLRWTVGEQAVRRSHPPRDVQPFEPFLGQAVPVISPTELQSSAFSEAHLRGSKPHGLARAPVDRGRGRRLSWRRGSGSCTATTAASTRSPTSAGSARTTRPSCAPPTAWSATHRRGPVRARPCSSRPTTVRSHVGDRIVHPVRRDAGRGRDSSRVRAASAGSTPSPARSRRSSRRRPRRSATTAGSSPGADARRALVRTDDGAGRPGPAR